MKVAVTGASGTIGSAVCEHLKSLDHRLVGLSRSESRFVDEWIDVDFARTESHLVLDDTMLSNVDALVLACGVDSLLGGKDFDQFVSERAMRINALSQLQLASAYCRSRSESERPSRIVAISSSTLDEEVADALIYSATKAALEEGLRILALDQRLTPTAVTAIRAPYVGVPMATVEELPSSRRREGSGELNGSVLQGVVNAITQAVESNEPQKSRYRVM